MHDQPIEIDPAVQDRRDQAAVLAHVLALYPESSTLGELIRELSAGSADFPQRDRIERAVRDLRGVGLLRFVSGLVLPTRAAVAFHAIREDE